jgi:heme/copper-type cytochrome/quinol oxidase subunit 1
VLGVGDHKVIGRLFIITSLVFLVAAVAATELLAVDRLEDHGDHHLFLTNAKAFTQLFTTHEYVGVFLGLLPLFLGIALVVVPLQIGARTIAFPRAATAAYGMYMLGGALMIASIAANGGLAGDRNKGIELWFLALGLVLIALLLAAGCVITTVFALRAPGMTLDRVPLFTWGFLAASVIWLLTLPVLLASLLVYYVDFRHGGVMVGDVATGSLYFKTLWAVRQPELYAIAAPALGFFGDVLPVTARARYDSKLLEYQGALINIGAFAVLGFGAFLVTSVGRTTHSLVFIVMAFLAPLPVLALLALSGDLFRRGAKVGKPQVGAAFMFATAGVVLLVVATIAGAVRSVPPAKVQGTLFDSGHFLLILLAGVAAAIGALHFWSTKIIGKPVNDLAGAGAGFLVLAGGFVYGVAEMVNGGFGNQVQSGATGMVGWNYVAAAGGAVALLGVVLGVVNLLPALRPGGGEAPSDPWDGHTLEWLTTSPPEPGNFAEVPYVTSEAPLLDRREATGSTSEQEEAR